MKASKILFTNFPGTETSTCLGLIEKIHNTGELIPQDKYEWRRMCDLLREFSRAKEEQKSIELEDGSIFPWDYILIPEEKQFLNVAHVNHIHYANFGFSTKAKKADPYYEHLSYESLCSLIGGPEVFSATYTVGNDLKYLLWGGNFVPFRLREEEGHFYFCLNVTDCETKERRVEEYEVLARVGEDLYLLNDEEGGVAKIEFSKQRPNFNPLLEKMKEVLPLWKVLPEFIFGKENNNKTEERVLPEADPEKTWMDLDSSEKIEGGIELDPSYFEKHNAKESLLEEKIKTLPSEFPAQKEDGVLYVKVWMRYEINTKIPPYSRFRWVQVPDTQVVKYKEIIPLYAKKMFQDWEVGLLELISISFSVSQSICSAWGPEELTSVPSFEEVQEQVRLNDRSTNGGTLDEYGPDGFVYSTGGGIKFSIKRKGSDWEFGIFTEKYRSIYYNALEKNWELLPQ